MPSDHRLVVNLRGTPDYERYLARVVKAAIKAGMPLDPGEVNKLAEVAIYELGERLGVKPVQRMPTPGRKPAAKKPPKGKPTP